MFGLALLIVYVFLLSFKHFDHLAWGRGSWSLCLWCICLLAMHTSICVTFSLPPGVRLTTTSACGSSWTFLFTFLKFACQRCNLDTDYIFSLLNKSYTCNYLLS